MFWIFEFHKQYTQDEVEILVVYTHKMC